MVQFQQQQKRKKNQFYYLKLNLNGDIHLEFEHNASNILL
jgi:hypothetical protein